MRSHLSLQKVKESKDSKRAEIREAEYFEDLRLKLIQNSYGRDPLKPFGFILDSLVKLGNSNKVKFLNLLLDCSPNMASYLPKVLHAKTSENALQPSEAQVTVLRAFQKIFQFSELGLNEWLAHFADLSIFSRGSKDVDYDIRADAIWDKWSQSVTANGKVSDLVLMDGHGRIVYRLLRKLMDANMNGSIPEGDIRKIIVVDLSKTVDDWHREFFPKNYVVSVKGDIFKYVETLMPKSYYLYLNFCGVGSMVNSIMKLDQNFMLSFSTMRLNNSLTAVHKYLETRTKCDDKLSGMVGELYRYLTETSFSIVSIRADFVTICVKSMLNMTPVKEIAVNSLKRSRLQSPDSHGQNYSKQRRLSRRLPPEYESDYDG